MERACRDTEPGSARAVPTEPVLAWKVHLLREDPAKVFLIAPIMLVSLLLSYVIFHSLFLMAVTLFLFASSVAEFIFPIRYEIDNNGASSRTLLSRAHIEWDRVKKYYLDDRGIKLSPLPMPGRLEAYRGVYLRFGNQRDEVVQAVRRMRDEIRARPDGS